MSITLKPFEQRILVELSSRVKEAQTFLLDKVLRGQEYVASRKLDLVNYYGAHRIAPHRDVYEEAAQIPNIEKRASAIELPRFSIRREIHAADILYQSTSLFGDSSLTSVNEAFRRTTVENMRDLVNRLYRTLEYMLGTMISNAQGVVDFFGKEYSIGNIAQHTSNTNWSAAATDVIQCISDMKQSVLQQIGSTSNVRFFGLFNGSVGKHLRKNSAYKDYFALTYNGEVFIQTPAELESYKQVKYYGSVEGVEMVQYNDVYVSLTEQNDSTVSPIIPDNRFILIAVLPENRLYYTHAPNLDSFSAKNMIYAKQEPEFKNGKEYINMIAEVNAFPFAEKDGICIANIS